MYRRSPDGLLLLCLDRAFTDRVMSTHGRSYVIRLGQVVVRNQQNLYPRIPTTDVAKLLQYSGSRVKHKDEFSS